MPGLVARRSWRTVEPFAGAGLVAARSPVSSACVAVAQGRPARPGFAVPPTLGLDAPRLRAGCVAARAWRLVLSRAGAPALGGGLMRYAGKQAGMPCRKGDQIGRRPRGERVCQAG